MKKSNLLAVKKLKKDGYTVLKKKITEKNCFKLKHILKNFNKKFSNKIYPIEYNYNLACLNRDFLRLAFDKDLNEIAELFFQYEVDKKIKTKNLQYHLNYMHHRCLNRPTPSQKLHIDGKIPGSNPPLAMSVIIFLDDVDEDNGSFTVVPKSHRINRLPKESDKFKLKKICGKRGTIIPISGSLFHGSAKKINNKSRSVIIMNFTRWFMSQNFALPFLLDQKTSKSLSEREKRILGFFDYPSLVDKKNKFKIDRNIFFEKGNIFITGNNKKTVKLSRNLYRKNALDYKSFL